MELLRYVVGLFSFFNIVFGLPFAFGASDRLYDIVPVIMSRFTRGSDAVVIYGRSSLWTG